MEHVPVLLREALELLAVRPEGLYWDATAGLGGHTAAIAARLTTGLVIATDRDAESLELARRNTSAFSGRIRFRKAAFSELRATLAELGIAKMDGLLADLGCSRCQLLSPERGLSLSVDGPLDGRMDRSTGPTVGDLVNTRSAKEIADSLHSLGEIRRARKIAASIVAARPIRSTLHLASVVAKAAPFTKRIHPATQTFMALRRWVNQEHQELVALLAGAPELVASGGRIVIMSFMSLEDRLVKQSFRELERQGRARLLTKRVIRPSEEEVSGNPASRSAKLRALEMT
ncbi:MAG: 16S rRNA (cytosine(1402)-N(4))-methyltransferase RsmH [Acidobacteria bacterium]|nr:16S rRNA (cytosine(1402)-N(4))-methyltransferase RsmH [Acidobacteriota bacterium]